MDRGRLATLVVVDRSGSIRGVTDPFPIPLPWWQETAPLVDAIPNVTVLRLLHVEAEHDPAGDAPVSARTTYLAECNGRWDSAKAGPLRPWPGKLGAAEADRLLSALDDHPLRHPWARPGGPAADLEWVDSVASIVGTPRQHRTWNLSAIWSIPTELGMVWLKCVPPFFAHEAAVLDLLAGNGTPQLLAADGHRLLLAAMPGEDGYDANEAEQLAMVSALVTIQAGTTDRIHRFIERGVPDMRTGPLHLELSRLVERVAPASVSLRSLVDEIPERLETAAECGIPDGLVHGDPHGGNCRRGVTPPMWFDWGDSFIGNPLLDVASLHRMAGPVVARWVKLWSEVVPGSDPARAWERLKPIAALRMAWVYQQFLDNIEPSEHCYHRDDVGRAIADTEATLV